MAEGCLDYSFVKEYPHAFKLYNGKVIIGDGEKLIVFNNAGKEVSRVVLPSSFLDGRIFLDFLPISDTSYLITVYGKLYAVTSKNQRLLNQNFGELIRGEPPIVITTFQEYDSINDINTNGIKFFNIKEGQVYKYPTKRDLGTANFEKVNDYVALGVHDHQFCLVPIDTTKEIWNFNLPDKSTGDYWFIGKNGDYFLFVERDFNKKEDHLHFYDASMKFVKEAILDVSYDDISDVVKKDGNFYMEAPFGNFYTFDKSTNTVYVFRHTKKNGICYFPVENHLRVIR